MVVASRGS
jgi:hypothetical protein